MLEKLLIEETILWESSIILFSLVFRLFQLINVSENRRGNHECTIHRHCQHWALKWQDERWTTRTPPKTEGESRYSRRVNSSCGLFFLSMCDVRVFLTFTSLNLVLLWQLFYLFCSSIVINTVTVYSDSRNLWAVMKAAGMAL